MLPSAAVLIRVAFLPRPRCRLSRVPAIQMAKLYPHSVISRRGPIKRPRADYSLGSTLEGFFSASSRLASFLEITFPLLLLAISLTFVFAQSVFSLFTLFDNPPLFSYFLGSSHLLASGHLFCIL